MTDNYIMEPYKKIFIIYKSDGVVSFAAYKSFQSAVDAVAKTLEQENAQAKIDGFYEDDEECPAKMEKQLTYKDEQGGVMVAHNELEKISTFVKELNLY